MKSVASLDPGTCATLASLLKEQQIACEVRSGTDENGLEWSEVLVEDASYDQACDFVEAWQNQKDLENRRKRKCPKCESYRLQVVQDEHYEKAGLSVIRCLDCGALIPC